VPATPREIYERYVWAGMTQNADALAEMFAADYQRPADKRCRPGPRPGSRWPRHQYARARLARCPVF
jgi:hypothetical protein